MGKKRILMIFILYLVINSIFYINIGFVPDESNFLFTSEKMVEGFSPYKDYSTDVKPPLNYYFYSFFIATGLDQLFVFRIVALLVNIVSAYILYLLVSKLSDEKTALLSVIALLFIFTMPSMAGYSVNGDRLLVPFSLASLYFFYTGLENRKRLVYSGIFLGLAIMTKQIAALIIAFYVLYYLYLLYTNKKTSNLKSYVPSFLVIIIFSLIPIAIISIHFVSMGAFGEMINWTTNEVNNIRADDTWIKDISKLTQLDTLYTFSVFSPIFLLALVAFILILRRAYSGQAKRNDLFLALLLIASSYPFILTFRYTGVMIIPLSVLASTSFIVFVKFFQSKGFSYMKIFSLLVIIVLIAGSVSLNLYSVFRLQETNALGNQDQNEVIEYVINNVEKGQKIYVYGYAPIIYYLSERDPPTGLYYVYPFVEHVNATEQSRTVEILKQNEVSTIIVFMIEESRLYNPITFSFIEENFSLELQTGRFHIFTKN